MAAHIPISTSHGNPRRSPQRRGSPICRLWARRAAPAQRLAAHSANLPTDMSCHVAGMAGPYCRGSAQSPSGGRCGAFTRHDGTTECDSRKSGFCRHNLQEL